MKISVSIDTSYQADFCWRSASGTKKLPVHPVHKMQKLVLLGKLGGKGRKGGK
jgi:hypothetical protein